MIMFFKQSPVFFSFFLLWDPFRSVYFKSPTDFLRFFFSKFKRKLWPIEADYPGGYKFILFNYYLHEICKGKVCVETISSFSEKFGNA